jgi:hypothetical protein
MNIFKIDRNMIDHRCRLQFEFESSQLSPVFGKKILAKFSSHLIILCDFSLDIVD